MSFNRLDYDKCAYAKTLDESTSQIDYWIYLGKYENSKQCSSGDFTNNLEFGAKVDVESELRNQTRLASKCPEEKYDPSQKPTIPEFTPARVCENIHGITPTNIERPTTDGLKPIEELTNLSK